MASQTVVHTVGSSQGQFVSQRTITADGELVKNPVLAPAKVGALTTRTSGTAGTLTMTDVGHGITTGARLDIFWANADGSRGFAYGATVGTVSGTSVPFTGASGDALPTLVSGTYAITAMVPQLEAFAYTNTGIVAINVGCQYPAIAVLRSSVPAVLLAATVDGPSDAYSWDSGSGIANPLSAAVADVYLSHGSSDFSAAVIVQALIN